MTLPRGKKPARNRGRSNQGESPCDRIQQSSTGTNRQAPAPTRFAHHAGTLRGRCRPRAFRRRRRASLSVPTRSAHPTNSARRKPPGRFPTQARGRGKRWLETVRDTSASRTGDDDPPFSGAATLTTAATPKRRKSSAKRRRDVHNKCSHSAEATDWACRAPASGKYEQTDYLTEVEGASRLIASGTTLRKSGPGNGDVALTVTASAAASAPSERRKWRPSLSLNACSQISDKGTH